LQNPFFTMKKIIFILVLTISFIGCTVDPQENSELPFVSVNKNIDLNLPEFIDLIVPAGWAYTSGGNNGIIIYNTGIANSTNEFKAFDRACPLKDCGAPMVFNGSTKLQCICDSSEYSILDGSPQTSGVSVFAKEYFVTRISPTFLLITN